MLAYPPDPNVPIEATHAATYHADHIPAHAFVLPVKTTGTAISEELS